MSPTIRRSRPLGTRSFFARVLLAILPCVAGAQERRPADPGTLRDVRAVARAFDQAQLAGDSATLAALLADDLVYVRGSGALAGKREFIATFTAPGFRLAPFEIVRPTFVQLGRDVAIVGGETTLTGVADGAHFTQRLRYADTFHRRQGLWRVVHVQVTEIR